MKKIITKILLFIVVFVIPFVCYAKPIITNQGPEVDSTKNADLTINFRTIDEDPLPGTAFKIYRIANISDYGVFTSVAPFDTYNLDFEYLDDEVWSDMSQKLAEYIENDEIVETLSGNTDKQGVLKFENLELGLYLIMGEPYIYGARTYTPQVFLISLPNMLVQDEWEYNVEVFPKYSFDIDLSKIVDKKVEIVWDDDGFEKERPDYITIELYKDGELYDTVVLNDENEWMYIWEDMDDSFEWTVKEIINDKHYMTNIEYEDNTFFITVSYMLLLPQTGMLWWPVPLLFMTGLILFIIGILVKDKENEK